MATIRVRSGGTHYTTATVDQICEGILSGMRFLRTAPGGVLINVDAIETVTPSEDEE